MIIKLHILPGIIFKCCSNTFQIIKKKLIENKKKMSNLRWNVFLIKVKKVILDQLFYGVKLKNLNVDTIPILF